jgi:hypothetical protein
LIVENLIDYPDSSSVHICPPLPLDQTIPASKLRVRNDSPALNINLVAIIERNRRASSLDGKRARRISGCRNREDVVLVGLRDVRSPDGLGSIGEQGFLGETLSKVEEGLVGGEVRREIGRLGAGVLAVLDENAEGVDLLGVALFRHCVLKKCSKLRDWRSVERLNVRMIRVVWLTETSGDDFHLLIHFEAYASRPYSMWLATLSVELRCTAGSKLQGGHS